MTESQTTQLEVSVKFDAAHRLRRHPGKCKSLHGHSFFMTAVFECAALDEQGFVLDFSAAKSLLKEVVDPFDHVTILESDDPLVSALSGFADIRLCLTSGQPTTELICSLVKYELEQRIRGIGGGRVCLSSVTLAEGPDNRVTMRAVAHANTSGVRDLLLGPG